MLQCYFDDSGTHNGSSALSYGGLAGSPSQWESFDIAWRHLLQNPIRNACKQPLEMYHSSPCRAGRGDFQGYSRAESDVLHGDAIQLIIDNNLSAVSYAVDTKEWDELVTGDALKWFGSAEDVVFSSSLTGALSMAHQLGHSEVALMFDLGRKSNRLDEITKLAHATVAGPVELTSVSFASVKSYPGFQGADIVATESYWQAERYIRGQDKRPSPHFERLLNGVHAGGHILDREHINITVDNFNLHGRQGGDVPPALL